MKKKSFANLNNAKQLNAIAKNNRRKKMENQNSPSDLEFFSVHDSKVNAYKEPFPCPNAAVCIRDFETAFKKPNADEVNQFYINSEDYKVFRVGRYDMKSGTLVGCLPEHIVNLHDIRTAVDLKKGPRAL